MHVHRYHPHGNGLCLLIDHGQNLGALCCVLTVKNSTDDVVVFLGDVVHTKEEAGLASFDGASGAVPIHGRT